MSANVYFLARVWVEVQDNKMPDISIELHNWKVFYPQLIMNMKENHRPLQDWYEEAFTEDVVHNPEFFIPDELELCEEPVWLEVIGTIEVTVSTDYYGEYDEETSFHIIEWTVEVEDNQIEEADMSVRIKVLRIYCCKDCPSLEFNEDGNDYCTVLERIIEDPDGQDQGIPDDCPLEEL